MEGGAGEARAAATSSVAISGAGNDLSSFDQDRQMKFGTILVAETSGARIVQKLFENPLLERVKLFEHLVLAAVGSHAYQFY